MLWRGRDNRKQNHPVAVPTRLLTMPVPAPAAIPTPTAPISCMALKRKPSRPALRQVDRRYRRRCPARCTEGGVGGRERDVRPGQHGAGGKCGGLDPGHDRGSEPAAPAAPVLRAPHRTAPANRVPSSVVEARRPRYRPGLQVFAQIAHATAETVDTGACLSSFNITAQPRFTRTPARASDLSGGRRAGNGRMSAPRPVAVAHRTQAGDRRTGPPLRVAQLIELLKFQP